MPGLRCDYPRCTITIHERCRDCGHAYCARHWNTHSCHPSLQKRIHTPEPVIDKSLGKQTAWIGRAMMIGGTLLCLIGIVLLFMLGATHTVQIAGLLIPGGVVELMVLSGFCTAFIGLWVTTAGLKLQGM